MARVGGARVFFDVVGQFQAERLINDTQATTTVLAALFIDATDAIFQGFDSLFSQISEGVDEVVQSFLDFEKQLVRVRKFYGGIGEESDAFAASSVELGHAFGFAGAQSLEAAAKMAQLKNILGSKEAVIAGTEMGLAFAAIGEMETEAAMNRLINLGQQTGFIYGELTQETFRMLDAQQQADIVRQNSIRTLDQLNTIENMSVATMEQITFTLNQYAAQASLAGESIGEMAAMSALLIETGEESTRAGTGLRMMYQRLANEGTGASEAIGEYIEGVELAEIRQMSLTEVMTGLSGSWANMTQEQKQNLAITVGGGRHYVKFIKLMENHTRLIELQANAYQASFPAIDELNIRLNSSFMTLERLNAEIEDTKVRIGEGLANAYIQAAAKQRDFWLFIEKQMQKKTIGNLIDNIIMMNESFSRVRPIVDFGLSFTSLIVAMSTFSVITRATRGEVDYMSQSYMNAAKATAQQVTLDLMHANSKDVLTKKIIQHNQVYVDSALMRANASQQVVVNLNNEITGLKASSQAMMEYAALTGEINQATLAQIAINSVKVSFIEAEIREKMLLAATDEMNYLTQQNMHFEMIKQGLAAQTIRSRSIKLINEQRLAQSRLAEGIAFETQLMSEEVMISQVLDEQTLKGLQNRAARLVMVQAGANAQMMVLRGIMAERLARGENVQAIREEIEALGLNIQTMEQRRLETEGLILANQQLTQSIREETGAISLNTMETLKAAAANVTLKSAIGAAGKGLMAFSMISMIFSDSAKAGKLAMAGMAAIMVSSFIPAIKWADFEMKKLAVSVTAATGGLNLAIGLIAGFAVYHLIPETVDEDLEKLYEMETSLSNINTTLNDLTGRANEEVIPAGMIQAIGEEYAGKTFADIIGDPALAQMASDNVLSIVETLNAELADVAEGSDIYSSLTQQVTMWEGIYADIEKVSESHRNREALAQREATTDAEILERHHADNLLKVYTPSDPYNITGNVFSQYFVGQGDDRETLGTMQEARNRANERNEIILDANTEANQEIINSYRETTRLSSVFWDDMFDGWEEGEEARVEASMSANDAIIQNMEEFASNREELFWGSRENFTGALYKTIQQGQVENLLYKTEIMQTNNFYGITIDDAIDRVSEGVLDMLRVEGVIE